MNSYEQWLTSVGVAIATARRQRGWTQREAANKCGLNKKFYSEIEYGKRAISTRTLYKIVEGLGIPQPYAGVLKFITVETANE